VREGKKMNENPGPFTLGAQGGWVSTVGPVKHRQGRRPTGAAGSAGTEKTTVMMSP